MRFSVIAILLCLLPWCAAAAESGSDDARPIAEIDAMIAAAEPGATLRIPAGTYAGNLLIDKPITLDGGGKAIFDGQGRGNVIEVRAEGVTIRRCTIRASGEDVTGEPAGICVLAASVTIEDNIIEDALFGIDLRESPDSIIRGNSITCKDLDAGRRGDGIRLWWSHGCLVEDNTVRGSRDMVFWYSENLRITRNTVTDSRYGLHFMYSHDTVLEENDLWGNSVGVYLMYSNRITLIGNRMRGNRGASGYGIGLKVCDDITIRDNAVLANRVGLYVDNSPSSIGAYGRIESNMIAFNEVGLLATPNTHDNVIIRNAFIENEEPAATHGRGQLLKNQFAENGAGNYWSDYAGFDIDGDGIGDLAYEPRSLFGAMLGREPNLRLFVHSPTQRAIEFTARALPEFRPEPTLIDPSPLAAPPRVDLALATAPGPSFGMGGVAASLLGLAVAFGVTFGREQRMARRQSGDHA